MILQGTNHGTKSHSAPILPTMNLSTSANAMNVQADLKAAELKDLVSQNFTKKNSGLTQPHPSM